MSGLRFADDAMLALIEAERRLKRIRDNAADYTLACERARIESLPKGDRIPVAFHKANEGLCAVRMILGPTHPEGRNE